MYGKANESNLAFDFTLSIQNEEVLNKVNPINIFAPTFVLKYDLIFVNM